MRHKVFVTHPIPDAGLALLRKDRAIRLVVRSERSRIPRVELIRHIRGATGLLCLLTDKVDAAVLRAGRLTLKVVSNYAVGYDNIDVMTAQKFDIQVTNTPVSEMSVAVAEQTVAFIFGLSTHLHQADAYMRAGRYHGWEPELFVGSQIAGKTIGIVGLGRIGHEVAARAEGIGMHVFYHSARRDRHFESASHARYVSLNTLLGEADFITLHVPLLASTRHLIGATQLRRMKKTAYLINTSRGPVIDERALVIALKKHVIAGAALDVYEHEPKLSPGLIQLENVLLTPHIASATRENRDAMAVAAAKNILAVVHGRVPIYPVHA